jgi:hypothetical protein
MNEELENLEKLAKQLSDATTIEVDLYEVTFHVVSENNISMKDVEQVAAVDMAEVIEVIKRFVTDWREGVEIQNIEKIERKDPIVIDLQRWTME